jgi:hypothetical protein
LNLSKLAETLNSSYGQNILTDIALPNKFNFQIQRNDFSKLQGIVKEEFGLSLTETKRNIEHVKINFKKNDRENE